MAISSAHSSRPPLTPPTGRGASWGFPSAGMHLAPKRSPLCKVWKLLTLAIVERTSKKVTLLLKLTGTQTMATLFPNT